MPTSSLFYEMLYGLKKVTDYVVDNGVHIISAGAEIFAFATTFRQILGSNPHIQCVQSNITLSHWKRMKEQKN